MPPDWTSEVDGSCLLLAAFYALGAGFGWWLSDTLELPLGARALVVMAATLVTTLAYMALTFMLTRRKRRKQQNG